MSHEGRMARGEKWAKLRASANFKHVQKELDWMDSQDSIVNDIAYFIEHSTTHLVKPIKKPVSEEKK